MKKIYKTPRIIVVQIRTNNMLAESIYLNEETAGSANAGWTKEYDNTFPNKNVWDEEW